MGLAADLRGTSRPTIALLLAVRKLDIVGDRANPPWH
jgi:hypothetical protein